jgi:DNA polymerase/3'-5' exonuclease PolX
MEYKKALAIAQKVVSDLAPHCERIEIAGSIRRKKADVKDIEIVCIPKPYEVGLFESGIAPVVNNWPKIKGSLPCKYTQRLLPEGIKLDLFFAERDNWGLILAIRTGSANYSHLVLGRAWVMAGYKSEDGFLIANNKKVAIREEQDLFDRIGLEMIDPEFRNSKIDQQ